MCWVLTILGEEGNFKNCSSSGEHQDEESWIKSLSSRDLSNYVLALYNQDSYKRSCKWIINEIRDNLGKNMKALHNCETEASIRQTEQ